jgi:hypothetical protein
MLHAVVWARRYAHASSRFFHVIEPGARGFQQAVLTLRKIEKKQKLADEFMLDSWTTGDRGEVERFAGCR